MKRLLVLTLFAVLSPAWLAVTAQTQSAPPANAATELEQLLERGDYQVVVARAHDRVSENPADTEAFRAMGMALLALGERELGSQALASAITAQPESNLLHLDLRATLAELQIDAGDHDAAVREAKEILALFNQVGPAALRAADFDGAARAARLAARDDASLYRTALNLYEAGLSRFAAEPALHIGLGYLLLEKYNSEEAKAAFIDALKLDEDNADALLAVAEAERFDESPGAREIAAKVVELRPRWTDAHLALGRAALNEHDFEAVLAAIDTILDVNPKSAQAWMLQAAHALLNADDTGLDIAIEKLISLEPGNAENLLDLTEIAVRNRLYPYAVQFALRAVRVDDQSWRAYGLLGLNQLRIGADTSARRNLERSFTGDPFNIWVKNTLDLLDKMASFETIRSQHFELVAPPEEAAVLANYLLPLAEDAFTYYAERYGDRPPTPIRIEVFSDHADFSVRTVGLVGVDILGAAFGPVIAMDSPSTRTFGPVNWAAVVWHEIAHSFHLSMSRYRVPRWFTEGLSVLEEHRARPGWGGDVNRRFLMAFRKGELPPASQLELGFQRPTSSEQIGHLYYLSYLLLDFIEQQYGVDAIVRMLKGFGEGRKADEMVGAVTGLYGAGLDGALERFIEVRYGHSIRSLSPLVDIEAISTDEGATPYEIAFKTAMTTMAAGQKETAVEAFEKVIALFPEFAGPDSAYHQLFKLHLEAGRKEKALEVLRQITRINADDLEAQTALVDLVKDNAPSDEVVRELEKLLDIDPFDPGAHRDLAALYEAADEWRLAARQRFSVLQLEPVDRAGAHYELARALYRADETQAAHGHILSALEIAPLFDDGLELLLEIRDRLTAEEDN